MQNKYLFIFLLRKEFFLLIYTLLKGVPMVKTGYFHIRGEINSLMTYQEYYERGIDFRERLYKMQQAGRITFCCACISDDSLPLNISKNYVLRVASNKQQELHAESCPKSMHYPEWVAKHNDKGRLHDENNEGMLCFNVCFPTGKNISLDDEIEEAEKDVCLENNEKDEGLSNELDDNCESPIACEEPDNEDPAESNSLGRASITGMTKTINMYTWLRQTYSIKKSISDAHKHGLPPSWDYKSIDDFNRHFFGVSNDVGLQHGKEQLTLHDICYQKDKFYKSDYRSRYFMYAVVEEFPREVHQDWKYQYVKVRMPSELGASKAVVRIETQMYSKMLDIVNRTEADSFPFILTGYVRHDAFNGRDGKLSQWITLLKGVFLRVTNHGLYTESEYTGKVLDLLADNHILYYRPTEAVENFGEYHATAIIGRLKSKDILIDVAKNTREYNAKTRFIEGNPEFDVVLIKKDTPLDEVATMLANYDISVSV